MAKFKPSLACVLFVIEVLVCQTTLAGPTATAARDLELRAAPRADAEVVGKLDKGGQYEILQNEKAWSKVSAGGREGWVLFFYLSWGAPPKPDAVKELGGAVGLATARRGGQVTAVLGIRGIDEEQLKSAHFDADELKQLESLAVSRAQAERFAAEGALRARRLDYLPAAVAPAPADVGQ